MEECGAVDMEDGGGPEERADVTSTSGNSQPDPVITRREKRKKRYKGLGWVADDVEEMFWKVAVTKTKLVAGTETEVSVRECLLTACSQIYEIH